MRGVIAVVLLVLVVGCTERMAPEQDDVSINMTDGAMENRTDKVIDNMTTIDEPPENMTGLLDQFEIVNKNNVSLKTPEVRCIFKKTCNGTFYLSIYVDDDIPAVNRTLMGFGNVTGFSCADGRCRFRFETSDPDFINHLLFAPYVKELGFDRIESDYGQME